MKIPFDIKFRPQIESGEYKVFAHEGQEARIVCWDNKGEYPIVALVDNEPEKYDIHGRVPGGNRGGEFSLFIVTPEEEMTPFEKGFLERVFHQKAEDLDEQNKEIFLEDARYVLALAREQFIKDGYVIEKKAFHDAVENISDKHLAEMSVQYSLHCKVEDGTRHAIMNWEAFQKVAQRFIDIGKAEALNDLPRWKRIRDNGCVDADGDTYTDCLCLLKLGWYQVMTPGTKVGGEIRYLSIRDLEKLPGFND